MGFWRAFAGFVAALAGGRRVAERVSFRRDRARVWALADRFTRDAAAFDEVLRIVNGEDPSE